MNSIWNSSINYYHDIEYFNLKTLYRFLPNISLLQ